MSHSWTLSQQQALDSCAAFLQGRANTFVLRGVAGTGKTTLLQEIVATASACGRAVHLTAPTARAARVLGRKTGRTARTLHSHLYRAEPLPDRPGVRLLPKGNRDLRPTLLVVDEASMVPQLPPRGDVFQAERSLLEDLVDHIRRGPEGSQLLFVGDPCQLPPVGESDSVALCAETLARNYGLDVQTSTLSHIVRQSEESVVLRAAMQLRSGLEEGFFATELRLPRIWGRDNAVAAYLERFEGRGIDAAVLLAYANKAVHDLNLRVRAARGALGSLNVGDHLVVNSDAWVEGDSGEIALTRGAMAEVLAIDGPYRACAGLKFQQVQARISGDAAAEPFTAAVLLDYLERERPGLRHEEEQALFADRIARNETFRTTRHPRDDRFIGALRARYGYALTVHQAQGGEWQTVLTNPWVPPQLQNTPEMLRWKYTAITRAREEAFWI